MRSQLSMTQRPEETRSGAATYTVIVKCGRKGVVYTDVEAAAGAFHDANPADRPFVICNRGNDARVVAETRRALDGSPEKSLLGVSADGGVFQRAYQALAASLHLPQSAIPRSLMARISP